MGGDDGAVSATYTINLGTADASDLAPGTRDFVFRTSPAIREHGRRLAFPE